MRQSTLLTLLAGVALAGAAIAACSDRIEERVVHRENCEVCHAPRNAEGQIHGIEDAHPAYALGCTTCHGGNPWVCDGTLTPTDDGDPSCDGNWVYDKSQAHVSPGEGPSYLRNLSSGELDAVNPEYLRFINPGDFRVLDQTCGKCHEEEAEMVPRSTMSHTSGELSVARYRAGAQPDARGVFAGKNVTDPNPDPNNACGVAQLSVLAPAPLVSTIDPADISIAQAQDQYMVKSCLRCHLDDFGENRFTGDFRSSGCTACHMHYSDDGLSQSADPRISKQTVPHPVKHELTKAPPTEVCTHCHYRGGRIGISYQGYRESAGNGLNPKNPVVTGVALHGHDANYYIADEDNTNDFDETPPDLHFEAGMHCIDCHTVGEIHGDGHLYADTQCAVTTKCSDCHGTPRERAQLDPKRENVFERDGELWLRTKIDEKELRLTQVIDTVTPGHPDYTDAAARSMGVNDAGFSHSDEVECYTCHAGWIPSCYGCHVDLDLTREKRYHTTGQLEAGHPTGSRRWVVLNDLVLMRNSDGLIAPSMPAERFFMTVVGEDAAATAAAGELVTRTLIPSSPRRFTFPDGRVIAGFGQRAFNPHSTRRKSQFMACDRCHSVGSASAPANGVLLDISYGFGSERFPHVACDVAFAGPGCNPATDQITYQLDAIQTQAGESLVAVGHADPMESRPLNLQEIERMRQVIVSDQEAIRTLITPDAATDPTWPKAARVESP